MPSLSKVQAFIGLLSVGAVAQLGESPMGLCNTNQCDYCPNSLTTAGTGYPACVIYDRDTVLGGKAADYPDEINGSRMIYYDIEDFGEDDNCRIIIRTPASTDDENCGAPIYGGKGGICFGGATRDTFMVQYCCGQDCVKAGVSRRGLEPDDFDASSSVTLSSAVLRTDGGDVVVPKAVGDLTGDKFDIFLEDHGLNASSIVQSRSVSGTPVYKIQAPKPASKKRDCDGFNQDGRGIYTKTGDVSYKVSGFICDPSKVTIENSQSVSRTTTFGASISDPWGIVSASMEISFEESASQSYSYEFTPQDGQCGHVAWTPFFNCVGGTITGCEGGDQTGEVCTAKRLDNNQLDGVYLFVQTG